STDHKLRSVAVAAIKRKWRSDHASTHTRFYEHEEASAVSGIPTSLELNDAELPIASCFFDPANWTLITTRRVIGDLDNTRRSVALQDIAEHRWGDFKGYGGATTRMTLTSLSGAPYEFAAEAGEHSMIWIYAIMTAVRRSQPAQ
ncbi:MAG TPA: hypothetical protein VHL57_09040, partial [Flavobacteriales bacterium]|nr:hypothetical protein [Flavobacteriales bacterium]